ncbi:MAG TPA: transcription elongation factor GreAB, partial [Gammaproteobacteria bacterium]|nr:transcription elongation factor GreAB [Gammaproteobacteria bacterium]
MDKSLLLDAIVGEITSALNNSLAAAEEARATATNKENAAENKYDTLGLEAAYLAHGQSERVVQLEKDLAVYVSLREHLKDHAIVEVGSVLKLEHETGEARFLFIGPASGGLVVSINGVTVTVITPDSPLGKALLGGGVDD